MRRTCCAALRVLEVQGATRGLIGYGVARRHYGSRALHRRAQTFFSWTSSEDGGRRVGDGGSDGGDVPISFRAASFPAALEDVLYNASLTQFIEDFEKSSRQSQRRIEEWSEQAFTHSSALQGEENRARREAFDRIEWLGDAALHLMITRHLTRIEPPLTVRSLANVRGQVQSNRLLETVARESGLVDAITIGTQVEKAHEVTYSKAIADMFEAFVGFLYLSQEEMGRDPLPLIEGWLYPFWDPHVERILNAPGENNYKTALQMAMQGEHRVAPRYRVIEKPDSPFGDPERFEARVYARGKLLGSGFGKSKGHAQAMAAKAAVEKFLGEAVDVTPLFPRLRKK